MTLANMRAQGVRSLSVSCWLCHHGAVLIADRWPNEVLLPNFGPRMVCTGCGITARMCGQIGRSAKDGTA